MRAKKEIKLLLSVGALLLFSTVILNVEHIRTFAEIRGGMECALRNVIHFIY